MVDYSNQGGGGAQVYKGFRSVRVPQASSLLANNLATTDGTMFVTVKNTDKGGQLAFYNNALTDKSSD